MSETSYAAAWLISILGNDPTLTSLAPGGVWEDFAPEGTTYPWVVFSLRPVDDQVITGAQRLKSTIAATVKVVSQTRSYISLIPAADRIDALINAKSGTVTGGSIISCMRTSEVRYVEQPIEGQPAIVYRHLGGDYEILAQAS